MQGLRRFDTDAFGGQTPPRAWPVRSALLGAFLGLLLAWGWVQRERQTLEPQQAHERKLELELQNAQTQVQRATDEVRLARAVQQERERVEAARGQIQRLRAALESLADLSGVRLSLLRWDAQGWTLEGHADPNRLQTWTDTRPPEVFGHKPAQLQELTSDPRAGGAVHADRARFVLRWPGPLVAPLLPKSAPQGKASAEASSSGLRP